MYSSASQNNDSEYMMIHKHVSHIHGIQLILKERRRDERGERREEKGESRKIYEGF